jgi:3-isopropylmalate/(R)-2-methylmalate dehydratase small subunit
MSAVIEAASGTAVRLAGDDIDTDQIIAARYLTWITFEGLEAHLFEDARRAAGGAHPLDDPRYGGASILLVGRNFGCGSSREHAPQALYRAGIRAIVGLSFGEIFAGNCVAIGLPCVQVSETAAERLASLNLSDPSAPITVDLAARIVRAGNEAHELALAEGRRRQFLDGSWDALAQLLQAAPAIDLLARTLPLPGAGSRGG